MNNIHAVNRLWNIEKENINEYTLVYFKIETSYLVGSVLIILLNLFLMIHFHEFCIKNS